MATLAFLAVVSAALAADSRPTSAAQASVTNAEIQRLEDSVYEASRDVAQLRSRDASLASELQGQLDEARDEAIYLKVKLRKNEPVTRNDYLDLRDRIDDIRVRARGDSASATRAPAESSSVRTRTPIEPSNGENRTASTSRSSTSNDDVPVGTEFDVRLQNTLSSESAQVEDRFEATTLVDVTKDNRVVVPAGSVMRGVVSSVKKAGRLERTGSLTVAFDRLTIGNQSYPIRATVTEALESEGIRGEAGRIGAGAGLGAVIGGILGGVRGALAGILIGGGGTIAATEGEDVRLEPGTVLRVRLDTALNLSR
jgi:hypothetical protein